MSKTKRHRPEISIDSPKGDKDKAKKFKHKKRTVRWTSALTELPRKMQKRLYRRATPQ